MKDFKFNLYNDSLMWRTITVSNSSGNEVVQKTFKYRTVEGLKEQLISSFSMGTDGNPIELVDSIGHIVALSDLEDEAVYYLPPMGIHPDIAAASCWSSNKLWQTKDPIHDMISLPDFCQQIIDTPEFQRLRDVKQLGACSYVYIGANNSRFEHSIGTGQLAFKMSSNLKIKQPELGITSQDVLCVTIAGLCHDLGHGPFSHVWDDEVFPRIGITDGLKHEDNSVMLFDALMSRLRTAHDPRSPEEPIAGLTDKDLTFIKAMIHMPKDDASSWDEELYGRPRSKRFLYEIVSNKRCGLDVDKFDYIQRDCHNTGVRGVFEIDRVVLNAIVRECEGELQLCWPQKEVENLYEVFHTRESLHRRVYQHRVAKACEGMVRDAFVLAAGHIKVQNDKGNWLSFQEAQRDSSAYLHLSDWLLPLLLHGPHVKVDFAHPDVLKAQGILREMQHRKIWKFVGSTKGEVEDEDQVVAELAAFSAGRIAASEWVVRRVMFSWGMGASNPIEKVRFVNKFGGEPMKLKPEDASKMLPTTFKEQLISVYVKRFGKDDRRIARDAFALWCKARGIEASNTDGTGIDLTKCRKRKLGEAPSSSNTSPTKTPTKNIRSRSFNSPL